jgi:inner membrane protein
MPSVFSHGIAAVAITFVSRFGKLPWKVWFLGIACATVPDLDVLGFGFGIRYGDLLGHQGLTHSLFFAAVLSLFVTFVILRNKQWNSMRYRLLIYFFAVIASHGLLDAMTDGGLGVAFFSPFDAQRYFLPFRLIPVSPIGIGAFFTARGLEVITSEFVWIWIPSLLLIAVFQFRGNRII